MKLTKISQVEDFLAIVNTCKGDVTLASQYGDKYNMKSLLTQYVAIGALLGERGDELELFCSSKEDEAKFLKFFNENPEIM
jgi:hypothetical protein